MKRRVVITGLGILCPIGNSTQEVWQNVQNGVCGIAPITRYDPKDQMVKLAGEVKNFDIGTWIDKKEARKMDLFTQYAMTAAIQAMRDSGLEEIQEDRERWGCIVASGIGGISTIEANKVRGMEKGYDRTNPFFIPMCISNMAAGNIAIRFGLHGMTSCVTTACASSANAIGDAFHYIRDGYGDVMLAGGAEAAVTPLCIGGFTSMRALTHEENPERASIPFDGERSGFVLGEGAGILVLEELEHAKKRGAKVYAEVIGYGANCDAHHITAPAPGGIWAGKCMEMAMADAGIRPEDVDYINAHGTSTVMNDACESAAIRRVFSEDPKRVAVSSTKSMTGHLLGAAAAVEAVITSMAVKNSYIPPTIHYQVPDPECDLDVVPNRGRSREIRCALSNSFGFGGHNAVLAFRGYREA